MKLPPSRLADLVAQLGGELRAAARVSSAASVSVSALAPIEHAGEGALAPLMHGRYLRHAREAAARGAVLLVDRSLAARSELADCSVWIHATPSWVLAELLDRAIDTPDLAPPRQGEGATVGPRVTLYPGVVLGARVRIEAGAVIGSPGFGWAMGPDGTRRHVPQRAGVVIEDDVRIGANCTIDAGTLAPTRIRAGAKLDAQVHVGHNVDIGERTMIAAQSGFAGSSRVGNDVLVGGQVGVADHVRIGDGAQLAAKSGVIGDIAPGAVVAGYPAVPRTRWLRALATLYRRGGT